MNMRIEKPEALPPARDPKSNRWMEILPKLRSVEIGKYLVVTPDKPFSTGVGNHIEKFAKARGMTVKARKRGQDIWIERIA